MFAKAYYDMVLNLRNQDDKEIVEKGAATALNGGVDPAPVTTKPWYSVFSTTSYILNMILFAVPWTLLGGVLVGGNLVLNIWFNHGWAYANIFLIANTVYAIVQYIMSIIIVWEVDIVMQYTRWIRWISLTSGLLYTLAWVLALL